MTKARVLTFRLAFDLVNPPGLVELSRERKENPARRRVQTDVSKNSGRERLAETPVPVSVVHHAFVELREERLELLVGYGHRGQSLNVAVSGKTLDGTIMV